MKQSEMHLNKLKDWKLTNDVREVVERTCFKFLLPLHDQLSAIKGDLQIPLSFLKHLILKYDGEADCFRIGAQGFGLDFGFEDILHITGLPIDGNPVTGEIIEDPAQLLVKHLGMEMVIARSMFDFKSKPAYKGTVNLNTFLEHFDTPAATVYSSEVRAKAFIFYCLSTTIFPSRSRSGRPHYLPLLDFNEINNYAWGAAVLGHIKHDIANRTHQSFSFFVLALVVFALERFKFLHVEILHGVELANETPLLTKWVKVVFDHLRPSKKILMENVFNGKFDELNEDDINWSPYDFHAPYEQQLRRLKYAVVPCINFYDIAMVRPDICYRQLGLQQGDVTRQFDIPLKQLTNPNGNPINLATFNAVHRKTKKKCCYLEMNQRWANRFSYLVIELHDHNEENEV